MNINSIIPTVHEHEGYTYLEFEGEFYKGCSRCGGTGHYSYDGMSSDCYKCGNTSAKLGEPLASQEAAIKWCHQRSVARAARERAAEAKRMIAVRAMEANQAALKEQAPDVYDYLMNVVLEDEAYNEWIRYENGPEPKRQQVERNTFIRTMAEVLRYVGPSKPFTTNMIEAVRRVAASEIAKAAEAAAHPAPTGRVTVTGEIVSAKLVEGDYGTSYKILVKDDQGFKVWVSLAKSLVDQAIEEFQSQPTWKPYTYGPACWFLGTDGTEEQGVKGKRLTFTATLEPSRDDVSFAFGSRPTKGAWL